MCDDNYYSVPTSGLCAPNYDDKETVCYAWNNEGFCSLCGYGYVYDDTKKYCNPCNLFT